MLYVWQNKSRLRTNLALIDKNSEEAKIVMRHWYYMNLALSLIDEKTKERIMEMFDNFEEEKLLDKYCDSNDMQVKDAAIKTHTLMRIIRICSN